MIAEVILYAITIAAFAVATPILWRLHRLNTLRLCLLLFIVDITLTIEAAFYSDIVLIAVLHVITIPAFFGLIYVDLVKQHRTYFTCFVCGKVVKEDDELSTVSRYVNGASRKVNVHAACIDLDNRHRKSFSKSRFRNGIPE